MSKTQTNRLAQHGLAKNRMERFMIHAKRDWQLYALILLPVIYLLIFKMILW